MITTWVTTKLHETEWTYNLWRNQVGMQKLSCKSTMALAKTNEMTALLEVN